MKSAVLAFAFYFALVTGGMLPVAELGGPYLLARLVVIGGVCFAYAVQPPSQRLMKILGSFLLLIGIVVLIFSFNLSDATYALKKADALIFGTISASIILYSLIKRSSIIQASQCVIAAGALVLMATVVYKLIYGFWDREVVFLLNGPIVFGWLMGMLTLVSLFLFAHTKRWLYLAAVSLFILAVLWTQSKGPLVALALITLLILGSTAIKSSRARYSIFLFFGLIVAVISFGGAASLSTLEDTRFAALGRLATNQLDESDAGSVNARSEMLQQGLDLIMVNPLMGTGFGGWQQATNSEFNYPHNVLLEIFVEFGIPIGILVISGLVFGFFFIPLQIGFLALFFLICNSLSGDAGYLRFPLCFVFTALALFKRQKHA